MGSGGWRGSYPWPPACPGMGEMEIYIKYTKKQHIFFFKRIKFKLFGGSQRNTDDKVANSKDDISRNQSLFGNIHKQSANTCIICQQKSSCQTLIYACNKKVSQIPILGIYGYIRDWHLLLHSCKKHVDIIVHVHLGEGGKPPDNPKTTSPPEDLPYVQ